MVSLFGAVLLHGGLRRLRGADERDIRFVVLTMTYAFVLDRKGERRTRTAGCFIELPLLGPPIGNPNLVVLDAVGDLDVLAEPAIFFGFFGCLLDDRDEVCRAVEKGFHGQSRLPNVPFHF